MSTPGIFADPRSRALLAQIEKLAGRDEAVLITGPTGSGKEVAARRLHELGPRRHGPMVVAHCGAISEKLFEDAFFGHVRGAFNGAVRDHDGYLAEADGGTLLLDEVGELPLEHQVALLRVLDGHPFRPVGASKDRTAKVRFIAATHRDLDTMVRENRFREDLYARLSTFVLTVPPLVERPMDVDELARHHAAAHRPGDKAFAADVAAAAARLSTLPNAWPRGVRELQALVARADCFGVDEAELGLGAEWQRRAQPASTQAMILSQEAPGQDERDALAGLIRDKLAFQSGRGRPMAAASEAHALAALLLDRRRVPYDAIQETLGGAGRQTVKNNLRALCDSGLLSDDGEQVALLWPPVAVRLWQTQGKDGWTAVPPGAVPCARTGDAFSITVTSQLHMEAQFFVVTHHRGGKEPRRRIGKKLIAAGQSKRLELELVDDAGFEQLLVHLTWAASRGVREIEAAAPELEMPTPYSLHQERMALLRDIGPGWVSEYLIHHL